MNDLTTPPLVNYKTFLYSKLMTDLINEQADIAILGMPFGSAYSAHAFTNDQSKAPQYLRNISDRIVRHPDHYDFDIDGLLLQGRKDINFVDCGDVIPDLSKPLGEHYQRAESIIR